ncbi:GAF and ANTAR domain-containing protein [Actinocatenispora comari]|jgi:transcriptional regulator with GAF, ATPase, and Fis domain|uniref:Transcriptional regulator n=1 Tax=Actinocatenispora comari TaxID=2807577 RepID=A0A8J4AJI8_9ACTN|nr:GAF and ANTAR domain-containing protein [Actinocatenispora comari]GIL30897.1 transcriptional regulator [Actinocatenispora comari]
MPPTPEQATDSREHRVSRAFVALADTLVADFDIVDFLSMLVERSTGLLSVDAAAVILRGPDDDLQVVASSGHGAQLLERFAVRTGDGPCIDCVRSAQPVVCTDLGAETSRWPGFSAAASECGFRAVHALPMRYHERIVGVLTLLDAAAGAVGTDAARLGQSFADVATIGILQQRTIDQGERVSQQLRAALTSRIAIEQAKGVISERGGVSMDEAFDQLRGYARAHQLGLTALARSVAAGNADLRAILTHRRR